MKPNRPRVVSSTKNHITVCWDPCDSLILKPIEEKMKKTERENESNADKIDGEKKISRWYLLERKDDVLGWCRAYMGFKTQSRIGPMKPGDYYEFRLKVKTDRMESDWSDTLFAVTKDDEIPVAQLHRVVENGPVATLRKMLNQRLPCTDVPNRYGQTALRLAVLKNNTVFMGILLNNGADLANLEAGSGRTPLMTAAAKGHVEAVRFLLEKGSSWDTKDRNGCTAFNYAVDNSHIELVRLAVEEGVNLKTKDKFGWSPLMRGVVLKSSIEVLSYLLDNGSDVNESDDRRQTLLMQAVLSGRPETVQLLLQKGAEIDVKNIYGHSAYDMAKQSFNEVIVKMADALSPESDGVSTNESTIQIEKKY